MRQITALLWLIELSVPGVGRVGAVRTALDPDETVWVTGELWTAVADDGPLAAEEQSRWSP